MNDFQASVADLVTHAVVAGRSRADVLAALRHWVEAEEAAEREAARKPCEYPGCHWDAVICLEDAWLCGLHVIVRMEGQRQASPAAVWRASVGAAAERKAQVWPVDSAVLTGEQP